MSSRIDTNKPPQGKGFSITPDWASLNNQSDPFYLKAETKVVNGVTLNLENRYVVTVVTSFKSAGKSREDLNSRINTSLKAKGNKEQGFIRILNFYDKNPGDKREEIFREVVVEGWDINPRPNSRLKVLVSIAARYIDELPNMLEGSLGLKNAAYKVSLNTENLYKKINNVRELLNKYDAETRDLFGRIPNLSFKSQAVKINESIPALAKLMLDNEYEYSRGKDQEIIFGMDSDFKASYVVLMDNECAKPLDLKFDNFRKTPSFSDSRNNKLLYRIEQIDREIKDLEKLPMQDFIDKYIYNPPAFDFSTARSFSNPEKVDVKKEKEKLEKKTSKTYADYTIQERTIGSEEFRNELRENLESASEFVGDNIIGGLRELSNLVPTVNNVYGKVLNKVPIKSLIEAALECLNFRGLEFLTISKKFLNQAASLADEIKTAIFDTPTIYLKDDLPITDYLVGIYESIKNGIINALLSTIFRIITEIIKMLLDYCKECALQNETAGRGRFDGLNFGGLSLNSVLGAGAQSLVAGAVGAIGTGLTSTRFDIPGGQSTSVAQQQQKLLSQTQQFAQNPLLLPGEKELLNPKYEENVGDARLQEDLTQQANQAKEEMSGFLDAASAVLTPGEAGNMMLGCGASQDAIDVIKDLASNYPTIEPLMQTDDDILGFFNDIGKISGYPTVLQTIKEITDNLPEEYKCLCDPDDEKLRQDLLSNKDMDPELIQEQIQNSNARNKQRLEELNALLEKENILDGMIPPVYCSYDPKTGKVIPGIINRDHPKFDFTLNQTLDTLYDGVASAFNNDVVGYVPTVTLTPTTERIIPRTVDREINGRTQTLFNNEFLDLVGKGQYSFGALPPGTVNKDGVEMENTRNQVVGTDEFRFVHWLGAPTANSSVPSTIDDAQKQAVGMTRPLPESEQLYEALNRPEDFYNPTSSYYRKALGGRSEPGGFYTNKFGYSPVPIVIKERGQETYAPGFQETYRTFCYGEYDGVDLNKLKITDYQSESQRFKFEVPNKILDNLNIDLETLKGSTAVSGDFFNEQDTRGQQDADQLGPGFKSAVGSILGKINDLGFSLNYYVPYEWRNDGYNTLDRFTFVVAADTPAAFQEAAGGPEQLELGAIVSGPDEKVSPKAIDAINYRNIQNVGENLRLGARREGTPQDIIFRDIVNDSFLNGPITYRSSEKLQERPESISPSSLSNIGARVLSDPVFNNRVNIEYYNEVWRDIFCSFTNQIGSDTNPFFDLANLNALDLAPMRTGEQECPPHLLDIDAIKNRIKEEYSVIQCVEASFPNVNGLGSNKDNPFEKANLGGTILLILRTYIVELLLRSLHVFYWFRYKTPQDVDNLLVLYVGRYITQQIEKEGYFTEFEKEVIDLYERNFPIPQDQANLGIDYDVAIKYLVRQQIYSVSNRISKLVGSQGDISVDTILLQEWIRTLQIQRNEGEARFNKPCVSISNDIDFVSNEVISSLTSGELSSQKIEEMSDDTYLAPVGYLFREYFSDATGSNANVRDSGEARHIWSLNPDSDTFGNINANPLNIFGTRYVGAEALGNSKNNRNRERYTIAVAGLSSEWNASEGRFPQTFLIQNWDNLDTSIKYKYGVSPTERKAMANIIKFTAMAGQPQDYVQFSDGPVDEPIVGGTTTTAYYYPGWLFKQQFASGKIQTRDAIIFPPEHRSITDSGVRAKTPELGFVRLLNQGLQYQKVGSRSYRFDDKWQNDFDWQPSLNINDATYDLPNVGTTNYNSMIAAVVNREIFFTGDGRGGELDPAKRPNTINGNQISQDVWQPPPNLPGSLEGDRNLDTLQAARTGLYSNGNSFVPGTKGMLDEATLLKIKDWQVNGNEFEYLSDDWLNATDWYIDFNVSAPRPEYAKFELWNRSPYYLKIGESKELGSSMTPFDVLVENFMPRTVYDFSGRPFEFRWRYGYQAWRDEPRGIEDLWAVNGGQVTELSNDPWFLNKNAPTEFSLSPSYAQYGNPSIDPNRGPNFYNGIYQTTPGTGPTPNAERVGTEIFCNPQPINSILNPNANRGNFHSKLFYHGLGMLGKGVYNMSLLDLDPLSIINVLKWEQSQIFEIPSFVQGADRTTYGNVSGLTGHGRELYEKYNTWIQMAQETFEEFRKTRESRLEERRDLLKRTGGLPPARRPMEQPLTCNFDNGGLLIEPYIRAVELDTDPSSPYNQDKVTQSGLQQKQRNADTVNVWRLRNEFGRTGIINIEEFDEFIKDIAGSINTNTNIERQQTFEPEEILGRACGTSLDPIQPRNYEYGDDVLGNYFEELHLGIRLSYVVPIQNGSTDIISASPSLLDDKKIYFDQDNLKNSKAYYVSETSGSVSRDVNIIPITSMEIPFNMATRISDASADYSETLPPRLDASGYLIPEQTNTIGFFKATYKRNLDVLTKRMAQTDEYAAMFKYLFPVDRMLGINTIYSSTYLSSMKGIDTVFDATKEQLRQLLFILLDSGNYQKTQCAPSNRQFVESFLNGFDIKGLAGQLALIILKSSVLIFKGFMEAADINIILSRRIIDLIHTANRFIAQSQQLVNQASQAAVDTAQGVSDLAQSIYNPLSEWATGTSCDDLLGPGSCKTASSNLPSRPDGTLFDPIDENFIPEPQIWAVSLALLPATIFAPFFLGPPLTIPFGFIYWALDYKPDPNWLNSVPPSDWLNKLLNGESGGASYNPANPDENCVADLGLPPPGANADTLNRYYADQTPPNPDLPSELTGEGGPAETRDPTDRTVPTDSLPGEPPPSPTNEATGPRAPVNTGPGEPFDPRLESLGNLESWGIQETEEGVNPFAGGQDPSGDPEGGEGGGFGGPGGFPPF
jgi:hypothetical protein